jgi:hypothetical protein
MPREARDITSAIRGARERVAGRRQVYFLVPTTVTPSTAG